MMDLSASVYNAKMSILRFFAQNGRDGGRLNRCGRGRPRLHSLHLRPQQNRPNLNPGLFIYPFHLSFSFILSIHPLYLSHSIVVFIPFIYLVHSSRSFISFDWSHFRSWISCTKCRTRFPFLHIISGTLTICSRPFGNISN